MVASISGENICLRTLSVPRCEEFIGSKAQGKNCELRGTDHVKGQIHEHIFAQNRGHCIYYPSNIWQRV